MMVHDGRKFEDVEGVTCDSVGDRCFCEQRVCLLQYQVQDKDRLECGTKLFNIASCIDNYC